MDEIYDILWVEAYRPKKIEDMVLDENQRKIFQQYINEKSIPNLLFYGAPGTGKTTLARIITETIADPSDVFVLNGSSSTGIDTVRDSITSFISSPCFNSKFKIVLIDEFDYMSINAQAALRNIIENYYENARFIFTANYISKIIPALISRTQSFEFKELPKNYVLEHLKKILVSEQIEYDDATISKIIDSYYPDIRKIVNTTHSKCVDGKLNIPDSIETTENSINKLLIKTIVLSLAGKDVEANTLSENICTVLSENSIDYNSLYELLFKNKNTPIWAKIIIVESSDSHLGCMVPAMHFMSCVYKIMKTARQYRKV